MQVAIFMGSVSDAPVMKKAAQVLKDFSVEYKAYVVSAHRSPALLTKTIKQAEAGGADVIIAGAGLSAALPGAIASQTVLPVVAVPLECVTPGVSVGLSGVDALLSIVQMPPRIPVASVGIGNAKNAAFMTLSILAIKYPKIKQALKDFRGKMAQDAQKDGLPEIDL